MNCQRKPYINKSDLEYKYLNEERSLGRPGFLHFQFECWIISPAPPESWTDSFFPFAYHIQLFIGFILLHNQKLSAFTERAFPFSSSLTSRFLSIQKLRLLHTNRRFVFLCLLTTLLSIVCPTRLMLLLSTENVSVYFAHSGKISMFRSISFKNRYVPHTTKICLKYTKILCVWLFFCIRRLYVLKWCFVIVSWMCAASMRAHFYCGVCAMRFSMYLCSGISFVFAVCFCSYIDANHLKICSTLIWLDFKLGIKSALCVWYEIRLNLYPSWTFLLRVFFFAIEQ